MYWNLVENLQMANEASHIISSFSVAIISRQLIYPESLAELHWLPTQNSKSFNWRGSLGRFPMLCGRTRCLRPRIPDVGRLDVFTDLPFLSWGWHDPFDRQQHSQEKSGPRDAW